ncbi:MAG: hypothetical protein JWR35_1146 [Marmoricola sp.]|jgi:sugar phosphate isomerase/epimerase|nr:hypothetical protein [Marmoricola sp.]
MADRPVRVDRPILCGTTSTYPIDFSSDYTLERALHGIHQAGLTHVEIAAFKGYCEHIALDRFDEHVAGEVASMLKRFELTPMTLSVSTDLTGRAGVSDLARAADVASALGIPVIITSIQETADDPETTLPLFYDRVAEIDQILSSHDLTLALETHRGYINTGVRGVEVLEHINLPRFKLNYDMANVFNRGGAVPEQDLAAMGPDAIAKHIGHVHLKDKSNWVMGDRTFPTFGTGILDFGAVLDALSTGGYTGAMTLEVELHGVGGLDNLDRSLIASCEYLEQFWK